MNRAMKARRLGGLGLGLLIRHDLHVALFGEALVLALIARGLGLYIAENLQYMDELDRTWT
jgi:hypothetical protein